jgi:RNA recognition motif-containing protein
MKKRLEDMDEQELRHVLNTIGHVLTETVLELTEPVDKPKFCVLLFDDPKTSQYLSTCNRDDMIKALKETVKRLEGREGHASELNHAGGACCR